MDGNEEKSNNSKPVSVAMERPAVVNMSCLRTGVENNESTSDGSEKIV